MPAALLLALALGSAGACRRGSSSPEAALARLAEAVAARDARLLFAALDHDTRASWLAIQRAHRESYDIVLSNFPEGEERERRVRRFEAGALAESATDLFAREQSPTIWAALATAGRAPRLAVRGDMAEASATGARPLRFRRGRGGWGYAGFADHAEDLKRRAWADLEQIRTSAADWERAAARQKR